jgi:hypothetical protein
MKTGTCWFVANFLSTAAFIALALTTRAQFTEVDPQMAQPPFPCVAVGDYDNDGDLDVLVAGLGKRDVPFTIIYKNTGGVFADSGVVLPGLSRATAAWGDLDGDGDLDLAMTGLTISGIPATRIYRNDGGSFTQLPVTLSPVFAGNVVWGDYDGDGDLDLLVTGVTSASANGVAMTRLYRNDGGGVFTQVAHPFPDCYLGAASWADYDNDGKLDLVLTGTTATGGLLSDIWHNDGGGAFTPINVGLPAMDLGFAVWGDFDNDGDWDLLFGGNTDAGFITTIYRNENGVFTDIKANMLPVLWASAAWGDYDNDGNLDAMIIGYDPVAQTSRSILYRNNGNGTFSNSGATFHNLYLGTVSWFDYDNDGRLDMIMAGNETGIGDMLRIARNTVTTANTLPTAPKNLSVSFKSAETVLSWAAGSDSQTPAGALTYNVRVGTGPGGSDIMAPHSLANGTRLVTAMGNAELRLNAHLTGLAPNTTCYWSVQTIDSAFAGSPFATESSFIVPAPAQNVAITRDSSGVVHGTWTGTPGLTYRIESSVDLANWTTISSATANESANFNFTDTPDSAASAVFYRAVFP